MSAQFVAPVPSFQRNNSFLDPTEEEPISEHSQNPVVPKCSAQSKHSKITTFQSTMQIPCEPRYNRKKRAIKPKNHLSTLELSKYDGFHAEGDASDVISDIKQD